MIITLPDKLSKYIWFNGEFINSTDCNIHSLTHSLHYSGAVYEGLRAYNGKIFKLEEHTHRLLKSASIMQLKVPYDFDQIVDAHELFIEQNAISDAYIRPLIFRGSESLNMFSENISSNLMIAAVNSAKVNNLGSFNLHISRWKKPPIDAFPPQVKSSGHYNMVIVAQAEAKSSGFNDALMLDSEGFIAESTTANLFFVKDRKLYTPVADRFLAGITRQTIIDLASQLGIKTIEERLRVDQIEDFDECFVTGTSVEVKFVNSINIGSKVVIFKKNDTVDLLVDQYAKLVRE